MQPLIEVNYIFRAVSKDDITFDALVGLDAGGQYRGFIEINTKGGTTRIDTYRLRVPKSDSSFVWMTSWRMIAEVQQVCASYEKTVH